MLVKSFVRSFVRGAVQPFVPAAAAAFTPASLFTGGEAGDYWDFTDSSTLFQDAAKTTAVTSLGDPVGAAVGQRGIIDLTQSNSSFKPVWTGSNASSPSSRTGLYFDGAQPLRLVATAGAALPAETALFVSALYMNTVGTFPFLLYVRNSSPDNAVLLFRDVGAGRQKAQDTISGSNYPTAGTVVAVDTEFESIGWHDEIAGPSGEINHQLDGSSESAVTSGTKANNGTSISLGYNPNVPSSTNFTWRGHILRACILGRVPTAEELSNMNTWLAGSA